MLLPSAKSLLAYTTDNQRQHPRAKRRPPAPPLRKHRRLSCGPRRWADGLADAKELYAECRVWYDAAFPDCWMAMDVYGEVLGTYATRAEAWTELHRELDPDDHSPIYLVRTGRVADVNICVDDEKENRQS